jgi:hypothetical protein
MHLSFTAAIVAVIAALAVVFLAVLAAPSPCRAERTIQAAQKMVGCSAPQRPFRAVAR